MIPDPAPAVAASSSAAPLDFFAACPKGVTPLLADELRTLGAHAVREVAAGVAFRGTLETAYRACLWARTASRILLPLHHFTAPDTEALYAGASQVDWTVHLDPDRSFAVGASLTRSTLGHSQYAALRVKDALVDQFRARHGRRPDVDTEHPDVRIYLHLLGPEAVLGIDLSGESLHRRGYRQEGVAAPLKENLAAAILLRSGWPALAKAGGAFVDPLCGSGTLPIEAALIAGDVAPGLLRPRFGFAAWRGHDASLWETLRAEALQRRASGLARIPPVVGLDTDPAAVRAALENVRAAGLEGRVRIERRAVAELVAPPDATPGLVVANPPYGQRLGEVESLRTLYRELGASLRAGFPGWRAVVFTGNPPLAWELGLKAQRHHTLYNGALECRLLRFDLPPAPDPTSASPSPTRADTNSGDPGISVGVPPSPGADALANRLRKNLRTLGRWAARAHIDCYRLYDADLPEYALAVDLYRSAELWVHVQEYEAPATIEPELARHRRLEALGVLRQVLEVPRERLVLKTRRRQRGLAQYEKLAAEQRLLTVQEGGLRFLVNLHDYLDTGLFLDHRDTRALIRTLASGRDVLNLFAYTGTASVHAAAGGALSTTSVDLSRTYLEWAERNLRLNGYQGPRHRLIQADCRTWLERPTVTGSFGLIFLDPPSFSSSKRMDGTLDIQRDHTGLIRQAVRLLTADGILLFSTNLRRFRLNREALADLEVKDLSAATLPQDFARNRRIHQCFRITPAHPRQDVVVAGEPGNRG